jgi:hypothetical protein
MPGATDLLATWEAGIAANGAHRALLLHALTRPGEEAGWLLAVPVGERDADLLALRRTLFGDRANVRLACAECAEDLEFDFAIRDALREAEQEAGHPAITQPPGDHQPAPDASASPAEAAPDGRPGPAPIQVTEGAWTVLLRPPTSADLLAAAEAPPGRARAVVLARCVLDARKGGRRVAAAGLPPALQERIAEAVAAADPRADITFDVPCPTCGHRTKALLDPGAFLWEELDAWARGLLLDVHLLAATYGWSEPEVLALSPLRRRRYLELAGHA